ncbi:MAG: glutamate 5-kinase [Anaerolineales bacterium]|nr:glutamate 5-kinase [Anaerolineales bacterium]
MKRIVVKIGSSTLTAGTNELSRSQIVNLVGQIAHLKQTGHQLILVSSGAIAAGLESLGFPELPKFIPAKQMLAAVGQPRLMNIYSDLFGIYDLSVAQVLLTRLDLSDRTRYLNARNTLEALLAQDLIPIINENDTVATEEIRVGDNDNLSALVSNLIEADLLIMLTDKQGLFTADPDQDQHAVLIPEINGERIPDSLWKSAGKSSSETGTGGMHTKVQAADLARRSGTRVVITKGSNPEVILRVVAGDPQGTQFSALLSNLESRKRFILAGPKSNGRITVDAGAEEILRKGKSSLLPVGVVNVAGEFVRGDTISIINSKDQEIALGLANYDVDSMKCIQGHQSGKIESLLGFSYGNELVHHDNLVVV